MTEYLKMSWDEFREYIDMLTDRIDKLESRIKILEEAKQ